MKYLLTKEEFDGYVTKEYHDNVVKDLNNRITEAEKYILKNSTFKCIYDDDSQNSYCDDCPLSTWYINTCNKIKEYSK